MDSIINQFGHSAPVIGISGSRPDSKSVQAMSARVREAGAIPLLLANHIKRDAAKDIHKFDAAIILGNNFDIDPRDYIERYPQGDVRRSIHPKTKSVLATEESAARDVYEKKLIDAVLAAKMPLFYICGGMQQMNIRCGGTLHQHIPDLIGHERYSRNDGMAAASPVAPVTIVEGTALHRIVTNPSLYAPSFPPLMQNNGTINSFHHQAVDIIGKDLIASAFSDSYKHPSGHEARLVEAVEADPSGRFKDQFVLGVQWHPEFLPDTRSTAEILQDVRQEAGKFAQAGKRVHKAQDIQTENILSALPMLKELSSISRPVGELPPTPSTPNNGPKPLGKTR